MKDFSFRPQDQGDGVQVLVCEPIERIGFKNAFSTRLGGVSPLPANALSLGNFSQGERDNVIENRRRFLRALDASEWQLVTAKQFHSAEIRAIESGADAQGEPAACDALTANLEKVLLGIQTADCLPILIADERLGAFAAVHAGWRGALAGIVARTVERMQQLYDSRPADLHVAIGPGISAEVFEVGPIVIDGFRREYGYANDLFSNFQPTGKCHINLNLANLRQLTEAGVSPEKVYDCGFCTYLQNDLFFSYRREQGAIKPVGRLMGVIGRSAERWV